MNETDDVVLLEREEVEATMNSIFQDLNITAKDMEISLGAEKGDGYLSFLTRVDVTTEDGKELHVVIKCAPRSEAVRKFVPIHDAYMREIHIYEVIMPEFERFQREHGVPHPFNNIPKCLKTQSTEGKELLVLENIRTKGFQLWNRMKPMDLQHIELVFKTYGKLHAISYAMQQQEPEVYDKFTDNLFEIFSPDKFDPGMAAMIQLLSTKLQETFENDAEHTEIYEKLTRFKDGGLMEFWKSIGTNLGNHPVLRHGDCWVNNMMFKYEDADDATKPTDICLLDFQLARTGSPVLDLSYFLYVSAPKHLLDKLDDLLIIYYDSLIDAMRSMNCDMDKAMSFEELKIEWKEFARFGFLMSMMISKAMMMEKDEVIDFRDVTEDNLDELMHRQGKHENVVKQKLKDLSIHMHEYDFLQ
ncbi:uncharacterized protein [Atheta coriaria]|uniref:uncharacterized protein n=1 Tax=Dalotia coriaria TaxID=877792 RepID=UPI0031F3C450